MILKLTSTKVQNMSDAELSSLFVSCEENIDTVDLSSCELGDRDSEVLRDMLSNLPLTVTKVILSFNGLNQKTFQGLKQIFSCFPETVRELDLSHNGLYRPFLVHRSMPENEMRNILPKNAVLRLEGNGWHDSKNQTSSSSLDRGLLATPVL
jgi:hypothetical protein